MLNCKNVVTITKDIEDCLQQWIDSDFKIILW
jgi:hypothetical protein